MAARNARGIIHYAVSSFFRCHCVFQFSATIVFNIYINLISLINSSNLYQLILYKLYIIFLYSFFFCIISNAWLYLHSLSRICLDLLYVTSEEVRDLTFVLDPKQKILRNYINAFFAYSNDYVQVEKWRL